MICNYHVNMLEEIWLHLRFSDSELRLSNYNIYQLDGKSNTSPFSRSVLIYVNKRLISVLISNEFSVIEELCIKINFGLSQLTVATIYMPPKSSRIAYVN